MKIPYSRAHFPYCANLESTHLYNEEQPTFVNEQIVVDGRVVSKMVVKTINRREQEAGNKVTDFCLENQLAIGSDVLKSCVSYGADATDNILKGAEAAMKHMDAAIAASKQSQTDGE